MPSCSSWSSSLGPAAGAEAAPGGFGHRTGARFKRLVAPWPAPGRECAMRNSKVRSRLAAGKLRLRIRDLRNLGARSEQLLAQIGVHTSEELRRRGAVRAFAELKRARLSSSLNMFWSL